MYKTDFNLILTKKLNSAKKIFNAGNVENGTKSIERDWNKFL